MFFWDTVYNVCKILSPSSSLLLLAKTITHPAARSLCDSWASCYWLLSSPARMTQRRSSIASTVFSLSRDRMSVTVRPTEEKSLSDCPELTLCSTACEKLLTWLGAPSHAPSRTAAGFYWQVALSATCSWLVPGQQKPRSQSIAAQTLTGNHGVQQMGPCAFSCAVRRLMAVYAMTAIARAQVL